MKAMMRLYILPLVAVLLSMTACSSDDAIDSTSEGAEKIVVPVEIYTGMTTAESRATFGDPGYDDMLPAPVFLYAWACVKTGDSEWSVEFKKVNVSSSDWQANNTGSSNSKYTLSGYLTFDISGTGTDSIGRVYVVASTKELTTTQLSGMYSGISDYGSTNSVTVTSNPTSGLQAMTLDCSGWSSNDLRDLYSNTTGDADKDDNGFSNGEIAIASNKTHIGLIRLYHCAAKLDFNWEVAAGKQSTTTIASITATGLPTTCKVFEPTANAAGTGQCTVVGTGTDAVNAINDGNKWIGRACAYVLQPAAGTISYTATFSGREAASGSTSAAPEGSIYTTWYRVLATVK